MVDHITNIYHRMHSLDDVLPGAVELLRDDHGYCAQLNASTPSYAATHRNSADFILAYKRNLTQLEGKPR